MKYTTFIALLFICLNFSSCKKKAPEQSCDSCPVGGVVNPPQGFSYTRSGGNQITADSAFYFSSSNTLVSYYQGNSYKLSIKIASSQTGNFPFTTTANKLTYTEPLGTYIASAGSVNITSNANNKVSGDFTSTGAGAGILSINGQFTDIPKK